MIIFSLNLSKAKKGSKYKPVIKKNIIPKVIKPEIILNLLVRHAGVKVKIFDKPKNIVKEFSTITEAARLRSI